MFRQVLRRRGGHCARCSMRQRRPLATATTAQPRRSRSPTLWLLGLVPALTFGLGVWQVQRLQWKLDLIRSVAERLSSDPLLWQDVINIDDSNQAEYRRVHLNGTFDNAHSVLISPKSFEGIHGYYVVTPLIRSPSDPSAILVNRGFVSAACLQALPKREGLVSVIGILRTPPKKHWSAPINRPDEDRWYWIDIDAIAAHAISRGALFHKHPILVEETFEGDAAELSTRLARGIPVGRESSVTFRNTHATYAFIWSTLPATTAAMFAIALRNRRMQTIMRMPAR